VQTLVLQKLGETMTIGKLQKLLTAMVENGHGRKRVCVQKDTFKHILEEDGAVILDVESAGLESFPMMDDDGFTKTLADGTESCHTALVIKGDFDPSQK
jgi:hypothetical protein